MKVKSLLVLGSMAVLGMAMSSCSKEEILFDNEAAQAKRMDTYRANFEKAFGAIDPNQSWDFASMEPVCLPVSSRNAATRAAFIPTRTESGGQLMIDKAVLDWMHENMKAGRDNHEQGKPFTFNAPSNSFTVVPVFQGNASYYWELYIKIGDNPETLVWKKGQDISYTTAATPDASVSSQWTALGTEQAGVPETATAVLAPTTTFTAPTNTNFYFLLKIWNSVSAHDTNPAGGRTVTTLSDKMLALPGATAPAAITAEGYTATIVGCEDGTDNDFEDLVFMIYGKPVPSIQYEKQVDIVQAKRYMIEDLGGDDDFDFNDIVIDVQTYKTESHEYAGPTIESAVEVNSTIVEGSEGQRAILRAAGGTLNFTITIGSTSWTKSSKFDFTKMLNTGWGGTSIDYDYTLAEIPLNKDDWNPATNNIRVSVENSDKSINALVFPKTGEAPVMITSEPTTLPNWMNERVRIPSGWTENIWK